MNFNLIRKISASSMLACALSFTGQAAFSGVVYDAGFSKFSNTGEVVLTPLTASLFGGGDITPTIASPTIDARFYDDLSLTVNRNIFGFLNSGEGYTLSVSLNGGPFTELESPRFAFGRRTFQLGDADSVDVRISFTGSNAFENILIDDLTLEGSAVAPSAPTGAVPEVGDFITFESGQVRPLALSSNGARLYAVNTPDNRIEVFDVTGTTPVLIDSVLVGLEPVAVNLLNDGELWVVNHLSDSISIVDVSTTPARIKNTLLTADEPRDIIFAGKDNEFAFVTAAHRGQNAPFEPELQTPGIGRADVWVFDSADQGDGLGGEPLTILNMFGDTTRGLARNVDGTKVYTAVFNSGNKTTVLTDDRGEGGIDKPTPVASIDGEVAPETALIVQFDGDNWVDGGDPLRAIAPQTWNDRINLELPDLDVFTIDASGSIPVVSGQVSGVGTTLFNLAVNPVNEKIYVSNQEALNLTRFEGHGLNSTTVRGHFVESRITVIDGNSVAPRHLNKHIDYSTELGTDSERARSLATPLEIAVSDDGQELYTVALGSNKLARFSTNELENDTFEPSADSQLLLTGGGPTGVILDESRNRAYVLTRFDNGISVVNTGEDLNEVAHVTMYNPEPELVQEGRRFMYDADLTSSRGDSSCAACHVFGDIDHLAWDLGNPDEEVALSPNLYNSNILEIPLLNERIEEFHPMKGPMTTQSFRGMKGNGPLHWRGDRTGVTADADETLEEQAFEDFNPAFTGLLGRETELTEEQMNAYAKFALELTYPPNPIAALDNSLSPRLAEAMEVYTTKNADILTTCNGCHRLDPIVGHFGTDGTMATEGMGVEEDFKIPHLRNMYQKVGMFATNSQLEDFPFLGPQIRGFGFDNAGAHGTVFDFLSEDVFILNDADTRLVEELSLAFPSELNPIVGQQVTVTPSNRSQADVVSRVNLLVERAQVILPRPECDLVASAVVSGQAKGWVMTGIATFISSDVNEAVVDLNDLLAITEHNPITFTCTPPGNGTRIGVDRNLDGVFNG